MSDELTYEVSIEDHMSPAAKAASESVAGLTSKLQLGKSELSSYQSQLSRANTIGDIEGHRKYAALVEGAQRNVYNLTQAVESQLPALRASEDAATKAAAAVAGLARSESDAAKSANAAISGLLKQQGDSQTAANEASAASSRAASDALGDLTGGLTYVASAAAVAGTAIAALTVETIKFATSETEAKARSTSLFEALGNGSDGAGRKTFAMLDRLSEKLPFNRAEVNAWARSLEGLGVTDLDALHGQVTAVASAQALAEGGAEKYLALQRRIRTAAEFKRGVQIPTRGQGSLAELGITPELLAKLYDGGKLSAKQLGDELKKGTDDATKFGDALERAVLLKGKGPLGELHDEFSSVLGKAEDDFGKLFDSIDFTPLSQAASSFFSELKGGTASGDFLKKGITSALNETVVGIAHFVTDTQIEFLKIEIWAKHNGATLKTLWSDAEGGARIFLNILRGIERTFEDLLTLEKEASGDNSLLNRGIRLIHGGPFEAPEDSPEPKTDTQISPTRSPVSFDRETQGGRRVSGDGLGGLAALAAASQGVPAQGQGGVHIGEFHQTITAPAGVTNAKDISVTGLTAGLERIQLASGR